ncbi:MAG: PQQ-binding-like beta-propeller repeat protein [Pirellulales bacterium]
MNATGVPRSAFTDGSRPALPDCRKTHLDPRGRSDLTCGWPAWCGWQIWILVICLVAGAVGGLHAAGDAPWDGEVQVDEIEVETQAHFVRAEQAVREALWDEAVDAWLRAADAGGDKLVRLPADGTVPGSAAFTRYVPVQRYVQSQLLRLGQEHPALLTQYRRRVDAVAERLLAEAQAAPSELRWETLTRHYAASSVGRTALREYGEFALERGQHQVARSLWERTHPALRTPLEVGADAPNAPPRPRLPGGRSWWLTFRAAGRLAEVAAYEPATVPGAAGPGAADQGELADAAARLVLVSLLSGERSRADWELARLERRFPAAPGFLAGRRGPWVTLLRELRDRIGPTPAGAETREWPQFAANLARSGTVSDPGELALRPRWQAELEPPSPAAEGQRDADRSPVHKRAQLPFHPLVLGAHVVVQDASGIRVWHAATGEPAFPGEAGGLVFASPVLPGWLSGPGVRVEGMPRFPLSSSGRQVWARVGAPWLSAERAAGSDVHPARLVALDLAAEGRVWAAWTMDPRWGGPEWTWEGPPLVVRGRVYVGLRRCDAVQSQAHVACFDAASGRLLWRRLVAAAALPRARRSVEWTQHLLTWHEGRLFYHARVGVVACLHPADGAIEWLTRYPRMTAEDVLASGEEGLRRRELSPCAVRHDLVLVAAADNDSLFALEATTGQLVWLSSLGGNAAGDPLLGVEDDEVLLGGDALTWVEAGTGRVQAQFPPPGSQARGSARPQPRGYGRGLLAGGRVFWPTRDQLMVFAVQPSAGSPDGSVGGGAPRAVQVLDLSSHGLSGGNLALAGGMLFIAGPDRLYGLGE